MPFIPDKPTPGFIPDKTEEVRPPIKKQVFKAFLTPLPQAYKAYKKFEDWRREKATVPIREKIESVVPPKQIGKVVRGLISPIPFPIRKIMERKPEIRKRGEKIEEVLGKFTSEQLADAVTNPLILLPMIGKIAKTKAIQPMIRGVLRARRLKKLKGIRAARIKPELPLFKPQIKPIAPKEGITVFHGTSAKSVANIEKSGFVSTTGGANKGTGISLTTSRETAGKFANLKKGGRVLEIEISPSAKLVQGDDFILRRNIIVEKLERTKKPTESMNDLFTKARDIAVEEFKKARFDGIDFRVSTQHGGLKEIRVWNTNIIKTTPQIKPIPSKTVISEVPIDPVRKITEALKGAKPLRGKQEALYSAERARRVARVAAMGEKVPGEAGLYAQLGQLKGKMPKVQFESIRKQITQKEIDSVFQMVQDHKDLLELEKVTAKVGLSKLFGVEGGGVPTRGELSLLRQVFPDEFIREILANRSTMEKLTANVGNIINIPRAMMTTADLSAPLRQGIFFIGRPKQFVPAFRDMFKYAFSEKSYANFMKSIKARPTYKLMKQGKLSLTELGTDLTVREEAIMSSLPERIPGFGRIVRGTNRAYTGFLNKLRADVFDDLVKNATKLGISDKPGLVDDIAKFVNAATGRGGLGELSKASVTLNATLFSPRLMSSRLSLLNPVFYMKLDPFVRKEALKSLLTFTSAGATILGLAKMNGAEVGLDPRSADFGKIKIGDTRFDIWGGFQQYMVLGARLMTGEMVSSTTGREYQLGTGYKPTTRLDIMGRFVTSKTAPIASFALDLLRGKTAIGEKVRVIPNIIDRFVPMVTQDLIELSQERGFKGLLMATPAIFGTGVQTYGERIPMKGITPSGREKIEWRQPPRLGEQLINKLTGRQISTIPKEQWKPLAEKKMKETLRKIEIDKVRRIVLETGKSQTVEGVRVYMDRGIVKTKKIGKWR